MNTMLKVLKIVTACGGLALAIASANADSISVGTNANARVGDAKAAHADQVTVGIENGNIVAGGAAARLRIGNNKVIIGTQGTVSVPVVPTSPVDVVVPPIVRQVIPHLF